MVIAKTFLLDAVAFSFVFGMTFLGYEGFLVASIAFLGYIGYRKVLIDCTDPLVLFNQFYIIFVIFGGIFRFYFYEPDPTLYQYIVGFICLINLMALATNRHTDEEPLAVTRRFTLFFFLSAFGFGMIGLLSSLLYFLKLGYVPVFSNLSPEGRIAALQGNGVYLQLMRYGVYGFMALAIAKRNVIFFGSFCLSMLALTGVGFRGQVLQYLLVYLLTISVVSKKRITVRWVLLVGGFFVFAILGIAFFRESSASDVGVLVKLAHDLSVSVYNLEFVYERFDDFQLGGTFFYNFAMFVPGPDIDFTQWLAKEVKIKFGGGVTPTIVGEGYINFGQYLLVYAGAFGLVIGWVRNRVRGLGGGDIILALLFINVSVLMARSVTGGLSNKSLDMFLSVVFIFFLYVSNKMILMRHHGFGVGKKGVNLADQSVRG